MTASTPLARSRPLPPMLGGFAALAESAWMGVAQAWEFLEPVRLAGTRLRARPAELPRLQLAGLLTREMTVTEATLVLMASFFVSAALGAVRQVLFNAQFGAGVEANAYYAAFRLPDTLFSLIAGGALSSAMIPVLLAATEECESAERQLVNLVLTALLASVAALVLVAELFAPVFVSHLLAPGFDPQTSRLTADLTRVMLVQPLILAVGSVATAVLNSRNRFAVAALSVASHNAALIAGILATRVYPGLGIYGPALGVVGGAVTQTAILLLGLRGHGFAFRPAWYWGDQRLREVIHLLIPNGLAVGVGYAGFILDTAFASRAPQLAALPAIQNAWLLVVLRMLMGDNWGCVTSKPAGRLTQVGKAWDWIGRALTHCFGIYLSPFSRPSWAADKTTILRLSIGGQ